MPFFAETILKVCESISGLDIWYRISPTMCDQEGLLSIDINYQKFLLIRFESIR